MFVDAAGVLLEMLILHIEPIIVIGDSCPLDLDALCQFSPHNAAIAKKILDRIESYLALEPKELGKPLKGEFLGYWRYRWGDYRVIYKIADREILIVVLRISHRKDVYF